MKDIDKLINHPEIQRVIVLAKILNESCQQIESWRVRGISKEGRKTIAENEILKISAEVASENEENNTENETKFTRKEFNFSSFRRSFTLPENVNVEDVNATYNNGVLEITLPKKEEEKALKRMVEIS